MREQVDLLRAEINNSGRVLEKRFIVREGT